MGSQAKVKQNRRAEREVRRELENAGVTERVRSIFLGLKREDVQAAINEQLASTVPWREQTPILEVARSIMEKFGYNFEGVTLTVKFYPGRHVVIAGETMQEPPRANFMADASDEAVAAVLQAQLN